MAALRNVELEMITLGLVALGHASGYAVRRHLAGRPYQPFSAHSGATYRVLDRLEAEGWIATMPEAGTRERTDYAITPNGHVRLAAWLESPPVPDGMPIHDGILIKIEIAAVLGESGQRQLLRRWQELARQELEAALLTPPTPRMGVDTMRVTALRARVEFFRRVQRELRTRATTV
ncbi:MAG: PadR family transcriptional regulator [Fimbriimonadaceae bacterium]|nr:PadR family transcriptional regulator [Fimbriimonadaceae bacterium]